MKSEVVRLSCGCYFEVNAEIPSATFLYRECIDLAQNHEKELEERVGMDVEYVPEDLSEGIFLFRDK